MPHPNGGQGATFPVIHSFHDVYAKLDTQDIQFLSNTGEVLIATTGKTQNGQNTMVFRGENVTHGNVCAACWGFRKSCSGTRIGHAVEALDQAL